MGTLRFQNLSLVEFSAPPIKERVIELLEWSEGNLMHFSFAFVYSSSDPKSKDDYFLPIGFLYEGHLVTSLETISQAARQDWSFASKEDHLFIREHLGMYYAKAEKIPFWGEERYSYLVQHGKTPMVLEGPNIGGCMNAHQRRYVVYDENRDFVYGPLLHKLTLDK